MPRIPAPFSRTLLSGACLMALFATPATAAQLPQLLPFAGEGNVVVFDAAAGNGGWVGAIIELDTNGAPTARSFASIVTFSFDVAANALSGDFEFTDAADLASSLFGQVTGSFTDPASTLATGGQLSLDYSVKGGTGLLAGYSGYGLSFLTFDPNSSAFNNYSEDGLLVVAVPEPSTWLLMGAGLALVGAARRRRASHAAA